jgi:hypothetical protein
MRIAVATVLGVCLVFALGAPAGARAAQRGFLAGAAVQDVTPPLAGTAAGAAADARFQPDAATLCPEALFPDRGRFALQEPFRDLNGDGQWDAGADLSKGPDGKTPDPFCDTNANGRWDGLYADNARGPRPESTIQSRLAPWRSPTVTTSPSYTCRSPRSACSTTTRSRRART